MYVLLTNMTLATVFGLLAMALFTLLERRGLGYAQLRKGPNKASLMALLLPLADALKLFSKSATLNFFINKMPFALAPLFALFCTLILWLLTPLFYPHFPIKNSIILFLAISSLHVYALLAMGWSSNSKYSSIGMTRGLAQTLSYEISMALIFITILFPMKSFGFETISMNGFSMIFCTPMILIIWMITCVAETNRTPFDIAEGESELVSGFNTEYIGGKFALIFMSEYLAILIMATITAALFLIPGAPNNLLLIKVFLMTLIALLFIGLRASLPRMRYDNLMWLAWGSILPLVIFLCIFIAPLLSS